METPQKIFQGLTFVIELGDNATENTTRLLTSLKSAIIAHGGEIADASALQTCTHLVCRHLQQEAVQHTQTHYPSISIVSLDWLVQCAHQQALLPPAQVCSLGWMLASPCLLGSLLCSRIL